MDLKCADPSLQAEVDLMILDCLLHQAVEAVLADKRAQLSGDIAGHEKVAQLLQAVESYLSLFRANHPQLSAPDDVHFRLRVLKFSALFCGRLTENTSTPPLEELVSLRKDNQLRAEQWMSKRQDHWCLRQQFNSSSKIPLPAAKLSVYRQFALSALGVASAEANGDFYGSEASVSLLDLLSCFMELTAARAELGSFAITERWMHVAGQFMLQACLEQYLVCGAGDGEAVKEAFAWGYVKPKERKDSGVDLDVDLLFKEPSNEGADEGMFIDGAEVVAWRETKEAFSNLLVVEEGGDLIEHIEQTALDHPIALFEEKVISFLEAMLRSIAAPVLVQLEGDRLEGLSVEETRAFKERVGLLHT